CDEVDGAAGQLGAALGGTSRLELELALWIRGDERSEIGTARCFGGIGPVDLQHIDDDDAIPVIVSRGRQNFVPAAEHVLSHCLRRHVRITGLGEVAVCRAANKSALALRVEPALRFAVGNDRSERRALSLISAIGAGSALLL